jgi:K+-sensing histidine kinase KdpD
MDSELLRARYATFAALALVFSIYLVVALPWHAFFSLLVALVTAALLTAVLEFWLRLSLRRAGARREAAYSSQQVQTLLDFQRKALAAILEREVIEASLEAGSELIDASGASFLPYDEYGQSLPVVMYGKVPVSALENWSERLSTPKIRQACKACTVMHGERGCQLIPVESRGASAVQCFPIHSAGREVGVANYFFDQPGELSAEQARLMSSLLDFAGQTVQTLRLRDQEMAALRYLQTATGPKSDLSALFNDLLENVQQALDADFALIYIPGGTQGRNRSQPAAVVADPTRLKPRSRNPRQGLSRRNLAGSAGFGAEHFARKCHH